MPQIATPRPAVKIGGPPGGGGGPEGGSMGGSPVRTETKGPNVLAHVDAQQQEIKDRQREQEVRAGQAIKTDLSANQDNPEGVLGKIATGLNVDAGGEQKPAGTGVPNVGQGVSGGEVGVHSADASNTPRDPAGEYRQVIENRATLTQDEITQLGNQAGKFVREHPPVVIKDSINGIPVETTDPYSPQALHEARKQISPDVGGRFDAHGLERGGATEQLQNLNELLTNGVSEDRTLYTTNLRLSDADEIGVAGAVGASGPYDGGGFIAIGRPDMPITQGGIQGVLVNEHFYAAIPTLQERFPNVRFIRADQVQSELPAMLGQQAGNVTPGGGEAGIRSADASRTPSNQAGEQGLHGSDAAAPTAVQSEASGGTGSDAGGAPVVAGGEAASPTEPVEGDGAKPAEKPVLTDEVRNDREFQRRLGEALLNNKDGINNETLTQQVFEQYNKDKDAKGEKDAQPKAEALTPVEQRMQKLEEQVNELTLQNSQLQKTVAEMLPLLKELANQVQDPKEKKSLLEKIALLITGATYLVMSGVSSGVKGLTTEQR